jgi:hypothetical protein
LGGGPEPAGVPRGTVQLIEQQEAETELGSRFEVATAVCPCQQLEPAVGALCPIPAAPWGKR